MGHTIAVHVHNDTQLLKAAETYSASCIPCSFQAQAAVWLSLCPSTATLWSLYLPRLKEKESRPFSMLHKFNSHCVLLFYVCIAVLTLDAGLLARSQYPEDPATGHLDTGFSWFPCVYKRMLRWFPSFQVTTTCLSCSPPDLNFLVTFFFIFVYM